MSSENAFMKQDEFKDLDSTFAGYLQHKTKKTKKWKKYFVEIGNGKVLLYPQKKLKNTISDVSLGSYLLEIIPIRNKPPFWTFVLRPKQSDKTLKVLKFGVSSVEEMEKCIKVLTENINVAQSQRSRHNTLNDGFSISEGNMINQEYLSENQHNSFEGYSEYGKDAGGQNSYNIENVEQRLSKSLEDQSLYANQNFDQTSSKSPENQSFYVDQRLEQNSSQSPEDQSIYAGQNLEQNSSQSPEDQSIYAGQNLEQNSSQSPEDQSIYAGQNLEQNSSQSPEDQSIYAGQNLEQSSSQPSEDQSIYAGQNLEQNSSQPSEDQSIYAVQNLEQSSSQTPEDQSIYAGQNLEQSSSQPPEDQSIYADQSLEQISSKSLKDQSTYATINKHEQISLPIPLNTHLPNTNQKIHLHENMKLNNENESLDYTNGGDHQRRQPAFRVENQNHCPIEFDMKDVLFYGNKYDAAKTLFRLSRVGVFLVRHQQGKQILTVQVEDVIMKYVLKTDLNNRKIRINGENIQFENLEHLLSHYLDNNLPRQNTKLTVPYNAVDQI